MSYQFIKDTLTSVCKGSDYLPNDKINQRFSRFFN